MNLDHHTRPAYIATPELNSNPTTHRKSLWRSSAQIIGALGFAVLAACGTTYSVGGVVSGLNGTVVLELNGNDTISLSSNGPFTFPTSLGPLVEYTVTIVAQPSGQTCVLSNGSGKIQGANVTNVQVTCAVPTSNVWTWIDGPSSNSVGLSGSYGVLGSAAAANRPGARQASASWADAGGNLWLFGGYGFDAGGALGSLNDLWKFSPSTGLWTWMGGVSAINGAGAYGSLGTAAAGNAPGARQGAVAWTDTAGSFWLFGGMGIDASGGTIADKLNDLWRFDPASGLWTWVSGSKTANASGAYGTQSTAAATNVPGARQGAVGWADASGRLWLFGGNGIDGNGLSGDLGDLWRYDPSSGMWTWISGAASKGAFAVYGSQGVAAAANVPGARHAASAWIDASGSLWLFGGSGNALAGASTGGVLNDLWKFDPSAGMWIWISGVTTENNNGVYGTQGTAAATNMPSARASANAWRDASGNLWLFGGTGVNSLSLAGNDLWKFNPSTQQWTWVDGGSTTTSATSVYGTQGSAAVTNVPGGRALASSWIDASGKLWVFGGYGYDAASSYGYMHDLWSYAP